MLQGLGTGALRMRAFNGPEEFLEHTKLELFHDQVFCFTPKGKLIALPRKATPIDFAYAVHTDVGNATVGCKINGQISPLTSVLGNGDEGIHLSGPDDVDAAQQAQLPCRPRHATRRRSRRRRCPG